MIRISDFPLIRAIRATFDARAEQRAIDLLETEDKALAERLRQHRLVRKQRAAKKAMGAEHVMHPGYRFNPRHSNDTAIYPHFRQHYLDTVRDAAELARSGNPAHCRHAARLAGV